MSAKRRNSPKRSSGALVTFLIVLLIGILYLGWGYLNGNLPWQKPVDDGEPRVTWLEKESVEIDIEPDPESSLNEKDPTKLHLTLGTEQTSTEPADECLQTADKIILFFEHLDQQKYIQEYALKGSALDHFTGIINKLIANPPVVVRETDDLFAILNNMAHFFRVLGPRDILLIKDVLIHERRLIEPTMALLYKWSELVPPCSDDNLNIDLTLAGLYEYAGYFINTLGGQSYLFRRQLFLRLLIRYYSILIIDKANSVDANRYGIDIRYTLDSLISEIQGNDDLVNRQDYLENLIRLQEKYRVEYGSNSRRIPPG